MASGTPPSAPRSKSFFGIARGTPEYLAISRLGGFGGRARSAQAASHHGRRRPFASALSSDSDSDSDTAGHVPAARRGQRSLSSAGRAAVAVSAAASRSERMKNSLVDAITSGSFRKSGRSSQTDTDADPPPKLHAVASPSASPTTSAASGVKPSPSVSPAVSPRSTASRPPLAFIDTFDGGDEHELEIARAQRAALAAAAAASGLSPSSTALTTTLVTDSVEADEKLRHDATVSNFETKEEHEETNVTITEDSTQAQYLQEMLAKFEGYRKLHLDTIRQQHLAIVRNNEQIAELQTVVEEGLQREEGLRRRLEATERAVADAKLRARHLQAQYDAAEVSRQDLCMHDWTTMDTTTLLSVLRELEAAPRPTPATVASPTNHTDDHASSPPRTPTTPAAGGAKPCAASPSAPWEVHARAKSRMLLAREAAVLAREDAVAQRSGVLALLHATTQQLADDLRSKKQELEVQVSRVTERLHLVTAAEERVRSADAACGARDAELQSRLTGLQGRVAAFDADVTAKRRALEERAAQLMKREGAVEAKEVMFDRLLPEVQRREAAVAERERAAAEAAAAEEPVSVRWGALVSREAELKQRELTIAAREAEAAEWEARKAGVKAMVAQTEKELSAVVAELRSQTAAKAEAEAKAEAAAAAVATAATPAPADGDDTEWPASLITTVQRLPDGSRRTTVHLHMADPAEFNPEEAVDLTHLTAESEAQVVSGAMQFAQTVTPVPNTRARAIAGVASAGAGAGAGAGASGGGGGGFAHPIASLTHHTDAILNVRTPDGKRVWTASDAAFLRTEEYARRTVAGWSTAQALAVVFRRQDLRGAWDRLVAATKAPPAATRATATPPQPGPASKQSHPRGRRRGRRRG